MMHLPNSVRVGPITFTVREVDLIDDVPLRMGSFNSATGEILIKATLPDDVKLVTFWHEAIHAMLDMTGQKQSERMIDALSHGLVALFESNDWTVQTP